MIALEGHNLGRVTHVAVGSRRYRISAQGPGGHSWGDFGRPNAIQGLAKLIAELDAIPLPRSPKTTLNVGHIEGGVSINTIAPAASCLLDLRSTDETALHRLSERVTRLTARGGRGNGIAFDWRLLNGLDPRLSFMLSGGLNPDNVAEAIRLTKPQAVDVSSGVESGPGLKDPARIEAFIRAARTAFAAAHH